MNRATFGISGSFAKFNRITAERHVIVVDVVLAVVTITVSAARIRTCGGRCVGWVQHWNSVAYVRESSGQVSMHLGCNDR